MVEQPRKNTVLEGLKDVLLEVSPRQKAKAAIDLDTSWRAGDIGLPEVDDPQSDWPSPAERSEPPLVAPGQVPRRRLGTPAGRIALLHAVAHIELNAIDLAIDMAGRFLTALPDDDRQAFLTDWLSVAADEGRHFLMIDDRLAELGGRYGELPAHGGLWSAAERTRHDVLARLAIAPLVFEARGLDVTPGMIEKLDAVGDSASADVLRIILKEEVRHVALGGVWYRRVCHQRATDPEKTFQEMVRQFVPGVIKPPFNLDARISADLPEDWYAPLVGDYPR